MRLIVSGPAGITVPSGIAIRAHLFTADVAATVLSANADKGAFRTMAAAMGASLGHVDFTDFVGGGTGADAFYAFGKPAVRCHVGAALIADDLTAIRQATAVFVDLGGACAAVAAPAWRRS